MRDILPEEKLYFYACRMNEIIICNSLEEVIARDCRNLVMCITNFEVENIQGPTVWHCYNRHTSHFMCDKYYTLVFGDNFIVPNNVLMKNVIGPYPQQLIYRIFWELQYREMTGASFEFFESDSGLFLAANNHNLIEMHFFEEEKAKWPNKNEAK